MARYTTLATERFPMTTESLGSALGFVGVPIMRNGGWRPGTAGDVRATNAFYLCSLSVRQYGLILGAITVKYSLCVRGSIYIRTLPLRTKREGSSQYNHLACSPFCVRLRAYTSNTRSTDICLWRTYKLFPASSRCSIGCVLGILDLNLPFCGQE